MTNLNDTIESFELDTDQGKFYSKDHAGKNLVLFFFPKADTTGCTKEAKSFSDLINKFEDYKYVHEKTLTEKFTEENNYHLHEPVVKGDWDFVCFTDNENFESDVWDVRIVKPLYDDGARSAKRYKLKPHKYLSDYDVSVWVDIEVKIKQDISEIVNQHLKN